LTAILTATLIFGQQNFVEQIGQIFGCSLRVTASRSAKGSGEKLRYKIF
jgi:hypothetical protein